MITRRKVLGAAALTGVWLATDPAMAACVRDKGSVADELSRFVTDQADRGLFSGTVLLNHRGRTVLSAAHGLADRDRGIPNTLATRFTIGSVGKWFTGVTAARLVQDGLLTFGTTFGEVVPQLRNPALRPLTLHQLLTHTAALPPGPAGPPDSRATGLAMYFLPMLESLQLVGTPGDRWRYSNAGYQAAAIMIEQAGERPFYTAVQTAVFIPARMEHTLAVRADQHHPPVAIRYAPDGVVFPPDQAGGGGGWYSTVGDLVAFAAALIDRRLLDDAHTTEVITGKVPAARGDLYAYGCSVMNVAGQSIIEHNGGSPGANAWLQIYPDNGYTLAVLSNVYGTDYPGGVGPIVDWAQRLITAA